MWSIEDVSPEQLAKCFYHYRGALAQDFGTPSNGESGSCWDRASEVFPTCVGVNRGNANRVTAGGSLPHVRGGEP